MYQQQSITLKKAADTWINVLAKSIYEPNTIRCYLDAFRRAFEAAPALPFIELPKLSHRYFQSLINSLELRYAKSTLNHIRAAFSNLYKAAIKNSICDYNPIAEIEPPRRASAKRVVGLTKKQECVLREYLQIEPYRNVIEFFLYTGVQLSELTNLAWADYDRDSGIISVRKSKTAAGVRPIPLISEALLIIKYQRVITHGQGYIF